jgi:hypothetical protein
VALTRATQRLFIAHSIPPGLYTVLAADKKFLGTCILAHLAAYSAHIQSGDQQSAHTQLQKMKEQLQYINPSYPATAFTEEIEIALQSFFERGHLHRNDLIGGVHVPLVIQPDKQSGGKPLVLLVDGVLTPSSLPSYEWEMKWRQYFQRNDIGFSSVYAAQWWKNPKQEVRKLAGLVLRPNGQDAEQKQEEISSAEEDATPANS